MAQPVRTTRRAPPRQEPAQTSGPATITVVDHADHTVTLPADVQRIAVCDIYPLPSVLTIFFDSAEKIVGMAPPSMSAAKNSLLSELYPDRLNAETGFVDGSQINMEELLKLEPDVVLYSASNPEQGRQLTENGFNAVGDFLRSTNGAAMPSRPSDERIKLLSQIFPENEKADDGRPVFGGTSTTWSQSRVAEAAGGGAAEGLLPVPGTMRPRYSPPAAASSASGRADATGRVKCRV